LTKKGILIAGYLYAKTAKNEVMISEHPDRIKNHNGKSSAYNSGICNSRAGRKTNHPTNLYSATVLA